MSPKLDIVKLIFSLLIVIAAITAFYIYAEQSLLYRVIGLLACAGIAVFISMRTEKGRYIWGFFQDAQVEVRRVVWPTRQETVQTTLLVVAMVVGVALILWFLDWILGSLIGSILGQGG